MKLHSYSLLKVVEHFKQNNSTDEPNWEKRIYKGLTFERNEGTVDRSIEQFRVGNYAITVESQSPCLCELT